MGTAVEQQTGEPQLFVIRDFLLFAISYDLLYSWALSMLVGLMFVSSIFLSSIVLWLKSSKFASSRFLSCRFVSFKLVSSMFTTSHFESTVRAILAR